MWKLIDISNLLRLGESDREVLTFMLVLLFAHDQNLPVNFIRQQIIDERNQTFVAVAGGN